MMRIRPYRVVFIVCVIYLLLTFVAAGGNLAVFVTLGDCFAQCTGNAATCSIGPENGYDGQFNYYIARDPLNAAPCIDVPAYRYQRILLPVAGRYLALTIPELMPLAFVVLNLGALVGSTALVENLLKQNNAAPIYALAYGLFGGLVIATRLSTSEPLAYGLCVLAIWFEQRTSAERENLSTGRSAASPLLWGASLSLTLAALAKETTLLFAAGFALYYLLKRRWSDFLRLSVIVGIPFAVWQFMLYTWFGTFGGGSGGAGGTPFEIIPFNGIWRILTEGGAAVFLRLGIIALLLGAVPSLWGLWVAGRELWRERANSHLYAYLLFVNAAVMLFVPFSTYREPLGLLRFVPGLALCHILYAGLRYKHRRPLRYALLWLLALLFPFANLLSELMAN
jgi:hypothetical protein